MISKNINENIALIKQETNNNPDYKYKQTIINKTKICLIYNESVSSSEKIENYILKSISKLVENKKFKNKLIVDFLYKYIPGSNINKIYTFNSIYDKLFTGFAIILIDNCNEALCIEVKANLTRNISEPEVEKSVNGPKDSFNESIITNIGLIKRRIKSNNLVFEEKILGKETKTKINIVYMKNLTEESLLDSVKQKIDKIKDNNIIDSAYIKNLIIENKYLFPMTESTERPDLTSMYLLEGKICILTDTSPFAIIIPTFFLDFFHTANDYYQKNKNISFTRIIRLIAFFISIITPAFYIAVITYNHETIPSSLLINIAAQRAGVPFPAFIEAILMGITFEILRESDIRQPSQMGSAISILGGIILGDAAVAAGIVSPIMIIVVATTAISSMIFTRMDMINAVRLWRYIFMIFASFFGLIGIYFCGFLFLIILCSYKSFGKPYLYPLSPINFKMLKDSFIKTNKTPEETSNPLLIKGEIK